MSTKVLFLSQYFWPEEMATSSLLSGIALQLQQRGYFVEGLAGQPAYLVKKDSLPKIVEKDGMRVRRVWSTRLDKNGTIGRIVNTATFTLSTLVNVLARQQPSVIFAVTNPPLLIWVAWINRFFRGTPFIVIVHDVYPDVAVKLGKIRQHSVVDRIWKRLNLLAYKNAERIVVLGSCMREVIAKKLGCDDNVIVIQNWSDGAKIRPLPREGHPQLEEWGLQDKFVIQYSGNLGLFHEIQTVLDAAEQMNDDSDVVFLFIGEGGQLKVIEKQVNSRGLQNIVIKPFQPIEKLPHTLTACDVALVTLKDEVSGLCVPSKLYGILAAGKPVLNISNSTTETAMTVRENRCGSIIAPGDSDGLVKQIQRLCCDRQTLRRMGENSRLAFDRSFDLEKIAARYVDLLANVEL